MESGLKTGLMVTGLVLLVILMGWMIGHYAVPLAHTQESNTLVLLSDHAGVRVYRLSVDNRYVYYAVTMSNSGMSVSISTP